MATIRGIQDNVNLLLFLCSEITAQLGFSPGKVRKDATGTLEAPVVKLASLQDVLIGLRSAIGPCVESGETLPVIVADMHDLLLGSLDTVKQLQIILRRSVYEEGGGLLSKMRKVAVVSNLAKDMEDVCRSLNTLSIALKFAVHLITRLPVPDNEDRPLVDLDEPPQYTPANDATDSSKNVNGGDHGSELPSYDSVKAESSSAKMVHRPAMKPGDKKQDKQSVPSFSEPIHAPNATSRDLEFILAVTNEANGIPELEWYLPRIDDMNARDPGKGTALQAAVSGDRAQIVKWLLEKGAHPDMEGGAAGTALKRAAAKGNKSIVNILLDFGANLNIEEAQGCALQVAQPAIFNLLLSRGASPDSHGVLYAAIRGHHFWKVEKLFEAGAEVEMRWHEYPYSPLNEVVLYGDQDMLRLTLARGACPDGPATGPLNPDAAASTFTPLSTGIYTDQLEQIQTLLQHGADPYKRRFFQTAAGLGRTETVKHMVDIIGLDINHQDEQCGYTPLMEASIYGRDQTVQYLLSRKADLSLRSNVQKTALQFAAEKMHPRCVKLLLQAGADPQNQGMLQDAAWNGDYTTLKLLLDAGADINARSPRNGVPLVPLDIAVQGGRTDMINYLISRGANVDGDKPYTKPPLWHAIEGDHTSIVNMLLELQANLKGWDPLHCAARVGSIPILQELLARGLDVDVLNSRKKTAALVAHENGHEDVIDFLVGKGARHPQMKGKEVGGLSVASASVTETKKSQCDTFAWFGSSE